MIRGQEQPMEDFYFSTEIMVKREIRNSQTTSRKTCHVEPKYGTPLWTKITIECETVDSSIQWPVVEFNG